VFYHSLTFSFYRHQLIRADFSGGRITGDAGLLPLRAFDKRHHLTRDWAEGLPDRRQTERVQHDAPTLLVGAETVFEFFDAVLALAAIVVEGEDFLGAGGSWSPRSAGWFRRRSVRPCSRCGAGAANCGRGGGSCQDCHTHVCAIPVRAFHGLPFHPQLRGSCS